MRTAISQTILLPLLATLLLAMPASGQDSPTNEQKPRDGEKKSADQQQQQDQPADQDQNADEDAVKINENADTEPSHRVTAEEILKEFQKERPKPMPLLPRARPDEVVARTDEGNAASSAGNRRLPDGYFLTDRVGQLSQQGPWWVIHFVADNNPDEHPEPPMKLLPNQMLERMVRESEGSSTSVSFVVSGEVTEFLGENYLLLRKLMRRRDMGNLTP